MILPDYHASNLLLELLASTRAAFEQLDVGGLALWGLQGYLCDGFPAALGRWKTASGCPGAGVL